LEEMRMVTGGASKSSASPLYKDPFSKEKRNNEDKYEPGPIEHAADLLKKGNVFQFVADVAANWPAMGAQVLDGMSREPANGAWNCAKLGDCSGVKK